MIPFFIRRNDGAVDRTAGTAFRPSSPVIADLPLPGTDPFHSYISGRQRLKIGPKHCAPDAKRRNGTAGNPPSRSSLSPNRRGIGGAPAIRRARDANGPVSPLAKGVPLY